MWDICHLGCKITAKAVDAFGWDIKQRSPFFNEEWASFNLFLSLNDHLFNFYITPNAYPDIINSIC